MLLVTLGTVYLFIELGLGVDELELEFLVLVAAPTLLVYLSCWVLKLVTTIARTRRGSKRRDS